MAKPNQRAFIQELTKQVMFSCRMMGDRGVTRGAFGHVSARIPGTDRILIKSKGPSEAALEFTTDKDIITIDIKGNVLKASKGLDAPQETAMHLAVYRSRPEVMSVIHTHPDWVVSLLPKSPSCRFMRLTIRRD
jgi:ribulose-5-phosphate 4-epimerase/fuculose-1-phosphate aldolase